MPAEMLVGLVPAPMLRPSLMSVVRLIAMDDGSARVAPVISASSLVPPRRPLRLFLLLPLLLVLLLMLLLLLGLLLLLLLLPGLVEALCVRLFSLLFELLAVSGEEPAASMVDSLVVDGSDLERPVSLAKATEVVPRKNAPAVCSAEERSIDEDDKKEFRLNISPAARLDWVVPSDPSLPLRTRRVLPLSLLTLFLLLPLIVRLFIVGMTCCTHSHT